MPTGVGHLDSNGVWQYGESDLQSLASDLLNLLAASTSGQFTLDRGRLTALEANPNTAYTPALTGVTVGNGTLDAHYVKRGKWCDVEVSFVLGSTSSVTGAIKVALPLTAASKYASTPTKVLGEALAHDVGTNEFTGVVTSDASTSVVALKVNNAASAVTLTNPMTNTLFTWATGKGFSCRFSYQLP